MSQKRVCRDFMANPKRDPIDGHRLVPGKNPYKSYVVMCAENDFDVDYMLDENFIRELSSATKRSTSPVRSPARSPRTISIPRSPKSSSLRSPLRSQPMLPARSFNDERSVKSVIRSDNLPSDKRSVQGETPLLPVRSFSNNRLDISIPQSTQAVYPRVVGPTRAVSDERLVQRGTPLVPNASYTTRSEQIGVERFDPDPVTTVTKIPERSERKIVRGPYGANGENVEISGVHKLPGQMIYSTSDIPEHEVRSVHNGYNKSVMTNNTSSMVNNRVLYPAPIFKSRSEQIGNETFNPDPVTTVTSIPPKSIRTTVRGPYGQAGENVITSGVYTAPGRKVYTTADIPEHEVRSIM